MSGPYGGCAHVGRGRRHTEGATWCRCRSTNPHRCLGPTMARPRRWPSGKQSNPVRRSRSRRLESPKHPSPRSSSFTPTPRGATRAHPACWDRMTRDSGTSHHPHRFGDRVAAGEHPSHQPSHLVYTSRERPITRGVARIGCLPTPSTATGHGRQFDVTPPRNESVPRTREMRLNRRVTLVRRGRHPLAWGASPPMEETA